MPLPANCKKILKKWPEQINLGFQVPPIWARICWWTTSLYTNTQWVVPWWKPRTESTQNIASARIGQTRGNLWGKFGGRTETSFNEKNIKRTGAVKDGNVKTRLYTINTQKNGNFNNDGQIREEARKSFIDHCALKKHALRCREG